MNIFRSDKAIYAVGLLTTLLGWHLSQIVGDITAGHAVIYRLETDPTGRVTALVHNISRVKSLAGVAFAIACTPGQACLVEGSEKLIVHPPNMITAAEFDATRSGAKITANLAANGKFAFSVKRIMRFDKPEFFYVPNDTPLDILVLDGRSLRGWLVERWIGLITFSLVVCAALFSFLVFIGSYTKSSPAAKKEE